VKALADVLVGLPGTSWRALHTLVYGFGGRPRFSARQARLWRDAARAAGLTALEVSADGLGGRVGPLQIRFSRFGAGEVYGTRIRISGPGLSPEVTVQPEGLGGSGRVTREIEVGDPRFDRAAWVEGPPALVRSVLDADTRRTIAGLFEGRLERPRLAPFWAEGQVDEGVLRVDVPEVTPPASGDLGEALLPLAGGRMEEARESYVGGLERLPDVLRLVVALARRLTTPVDVARRLAENLKTEPVAGVRRQCVTTLAREFPDHPAARGALLAACEDPDAEVRLRAGIALGPEGRETLLRVAGGEGAEDETTERAVAALGDHLTSAQAQEVLRHALRTRREATARACLLALGRRGGAGAVAVLVKVLAVERPGLAAAAAEALGDTADATAERPLLTALGGPDAVVREAAARALGRVGTVAAVPSLKKAEAGDGKTRAAARQAIAEIQARAKGAAPGQLSLAEREAGQLSIVSEQQGRLSLPADPSGLAEAGVPQDDRVEE